MPAPNFPPRLALACPHCGRVNEFHSGTTGDTAPGDGDVSLCWKCRRASVYVSGPFGLALRVPSPEECTEIEADPAVRRALAAVAESFDPLEAVELTRGGSGG